MAKSDLTRREHQTGQRPPRVQIPSPLKPGPQPPDTLSVMDETDETDVTEAVVTDELLEDELLVEEISIDGMCGVY